MIIDIMRVDDGIIVKSAIEEVYWDPYIWESGNYSCDCNRSLFFNLYAHTDYPIECGHGKYLVRLFDHRDNKLIYSEFKEDLCTGYIGN